MLVVGLLESWLVPSGAENFQMQEFMGRLELENQVIEGMMGQLCLVHNYNNLLIKQWDPGHGNTGNGWAVWPWSSIKADGLRLQVLHSLMSNIIPLPFETSLSASYADASELAQAMQHLEHHLAHIINIQVTSKCFLLQRSVTILPTVCHGVLFLFFLSFPLDYITNLQMAQPPTHLHFVSFLSFYSFYYGLFVIAQQSSHI